jgi:hypothetical protein
MRPPMQRRESVSVILPLKVPDLDQGQHPRVVIRRHTEARADRAEG